MTTKSTFTIYSQVDLSSSDFKVLALLYQPILGMEAYALYTFLYQLNHKTEFEKMTHRELFDLINVKQVNFEKMRYKLEALNLLDVYEKDDHLLYFIKTPLTAKQFLVDTVFGSYLQSEIGEENTKSLIALFKMEIPDISSYNNITKTFDEMFEFKSLSCLSVDHHLQGRQQNGGSNIRFQFDYERFVSLIPERLKSTQLLNDKFKDQITRIAFVYQFSVEDMVVVYENAQKGNQVVNFSQLNLKARLHFQKDINKQLTIKEKELSMADVLRQTSPQVIIQKYAKTNQHGIALQTASELLERNAVEPGIINAILMLVLKQKEGILPNLKYLEIVLNDWLNKGIQTTEDALIYAQELEHKWENKESSNIKKSNVPDWLDDYLEEIGKKEG